MYDEYKYPGKCPDIKSAVPVEVQRIFDSCSERDCISDLMVTLDEREDHRCQDTVRRGLQCLRYH